jgi:hypothetical protein
VQRPRQLSGATAEVDDAASRARLDQIEEIEERGRPLALEPLVLGRVPGVGQTAFSSDIEPGVWPFRRAGYGSRGFSYQWS